MAETDPLWKVEDQAARLAELTGEDPALREAPLRRDVRSLGTLLGEVIREQGGPGLFEAVEQLRHLAIRHREQEADEAGDDELMQRAEQLVDGMEVRQAYGLTRAFATYFELTNLAETAHRGRRRRAARLHADLPPQPGTFEGTLRRLREAGVDRETVLGALAKVRVIPVFTAHPTEVSRRTGLFKRRRSAEALDRLDQLPLADARAAEEEEAIAAE
ncbi:MAG: phosphoenolpyruvate carboxylase, partial [Gemmatimonadetes bacterium]|nr:phosphoenolpyruvate carboxylase [Gemmatimonadota bacterium]